MPNVHVKKSSLLDFPYCHNDFTFYFSAKSEHDALILTKYKNEEFFLQIIEKDDKYLLKADKLTRPTNVKIVQDALKVFLEANSLKAIMSNIDSKKNRLKKRSKYLKKIEEFINYSLQGSVEIEIGFGSGRHLLHIAKQNPQKSFIGIEIHKPSIEQLLKQCEIQNIQNISVLEYDARIFLEILESNSIDKIYIHFPVPWDKKPHRRVISKDFLEESLRVLKKGGKLELRTDSEKYFKYSYELFLSLSKCEFAVKKNIDLEISSKYEDRWKRMKKNIYDLHLINQEISEAKKKQYVENFEENIEFKKIYDNFVNKTIKKDGYFVHFENIYKIDKNSGIIKLSFGAYDKPEHKYLLIKDSTFSYLPNDLLPIWQNIESDKVIKEYLKRRLLDE